jgi:type III restriction enzyme
MLDAEIHHTIQLDGTGPADYRSVVAFFARQLLKDLRLVGGYDVLYPKVKAFMREYFNHKSQLAKMFPHVPFRGLVKLDLFLSLDHTQILENEQRTLIEAIVAGQRTISRKDEFGKATITGD